MGGKLTAKSAKIAKTGWGGIRGGIKIFFMSSSPGGLNSKMNSAATASSRSLRSLRLTKSTENAPKLRIQRLGLVPYAEGLELQKELVEKRRAGTIPDQLLLLEHPHVITLGSSGQAEHVLAGADERRLLGIEMFETGRGGNVTYHGPGQLVGYPIDRKSVV